MTALKDHKISKRFSEISLQHISELGCMLSCFIAIFHKAGSKKAK
jgi:hypothetical protein